MSDWTIRPAEERDRMPGVKRGRGTSMKRNYPVFSIVCRPGDIRCPPLAYRRNH